ncbi:MAG: hypothetical protein ACLFQK_01565 [Fibrobacterota bacterium]
MQLPVSKKDKHHKLVLKVCQEPGCGKEFVGHPIRKYCDFHRILSNRKRKKVEYEPVDTHNKIFRHKYIDTVRMEFTCELEGCDKKYSVDIIPRQYIYPKYCVEHRNEYKRKLFIAQTEEKKSAAGRNTKKKTRVA